MAWRYERDWTCSDCKQDMCGVSYEDLALGGIPCCPDCGHEMKLLPEDE